VALGKVSAFVCSETTLHRRTIESAVNGVRARYAFYRCFSLSGVLQMMSSSLNWSRLQETSSGDLPISSVSAYDFFGVPICKW
jgi:hypothetical protein